MVVAEVGKMRLPEFIRTQKTQIITEWVNFAESLTPAASDMTQLQLKDHIEQILLFVALDIESAQSAQEQISKSQGKGEQLEDRKETASEIHGSIRHADGFDIVQMVSEYRALRASIIKLWTASKSELSQLDMLDLTRFNEAVDQSLAESVARFMEKVEYSKDLLLGILGHDIRSPLGAITMSSYLMPRTGELNEKQSALNGQIESSCTRAMKIVADLLDLTRARMGTGLPIQREPMVMSTLAEQIVQESRVQFPNRSILLTVSVNSEGEWDSSRMGQVFSNLISNAIQYGAPDSAITVTIGGNEAAVNISVHNQGSEMSAAQLATIFNSFTRGAGTSETQPTANLGLGLFITKEIVHSHGGTIRVVSTKNEGTNFMIALPRDINIKLAA